jgi:hypothetical protein
VGGRERPPQRRREFGKRLCGRWRGRPEQQIGQLRTRGVGLFLQRDRLISRLVERLAQLLLLAGQPLQQVALLPQRRRQRPLQLWQFLVGERRLDFRQQAVDHGIAIVEPVQGALDSQFGIAGGGQKLHAARLAGSQLLGRRQPAQILPERLCEFLAEGLHAGTAFNPAHPLLEVGLRSAQVRQRFLWFLDRYRRLGDAVRDLFVPVGDGAQRIALLGEAGTSRQGDNEGQQQDWKARSQPSGDIAKPAPCPVRCRPARASHNPAPQRYCQAIPIRS